MIEQIDSNLYRIEIPLPKTPLRFTNSYFIRGTDKNLLIDTGFNTEPSRTAMDVAIQELNITFENTDIFLTHVHADHSGLAKYLARPETTIYSGEYTAWFYSQPYGGDYFYKIAQQGGLEEMGLPMDPAADPGFTLLSPPVDISIVNDDTTIKVGDFELQCFVTTGHAPDHICLYDRNKQILFSGDHILGTISPNNTTWDEPWTTGTDYLGEYLQNLAKIDALEMRLVLPGHRDLILDGHKRIQQLLTHHQHRLSEILNIVGSKSMSAAQVASLMNWDLEINSWDQFPMAQKLFATGEALSHLTHLVFEGPLIKNLKNGVVYYQRA